MMLMHIIVIIGLIDWDSVIQNDFQSQADNKKINKFVNSKQSLSITDILSTWLWRDLQASQ